MLEVSDLNCWGAWDIAWRNKAKNIIPSITWRREMWKEEALDNLPWEGYHQSDKQWNCLKGNAGKTDETHIQYRLFWVQRYHPELNWRHTWLELNWSGGTDHTPSLKPHISSLQLLGLSGGAFSFEKARAADRLGRPKLITALQHCLDHILTLWFLVIVSWGQQNKNKKSADDGWDLPDLPWSLVLVSSQKQNNKKSKTTKVLTMAENKQTNDKKNKSKSVNYLS